MSLPLPSLPDRLRTRGQELGFARVGIAPAVTPTGFHRLLEWLQRGYAGSMDWIARRQNAARHPDGVLPGARTVIMAAMNYFDGTPESDGTRIARYAMSGRDYHDVLKPLLQTLAEEIRTDHPRARTRVVVDTAPLLERDFGRLAGIGWFGKNTMLISPRIGSYFFLGAILTDVELPPDDPLLTTHCGTCTRCLDACPTSAFPEPGVLDARLCISYQTIEQRREPVPEKLRTGTGPWLFGCDICQDVCPWNRFAPEETLPELSGLESFRDIDCRELLRLDTDEFTARFQGTPLQRTGRTAILRNACIVLGNRADTTDLPELTALLSDPDPILQDAARWALQKRGQVHFPPADLVGDPS